MSYVHKNSQINMLQGSFYACVKLQRGDVTVSSLHLKRRRTRVPNTSSWILHTWPWHTRTHGAPQNDFKRGQFTRLFTIVQENSYSSLGLVSSLAQKHWYTFVNLFTMLVKFTPVEAIIFQFYFSVAVTMKSQIPQKTWLSTKLFSLMFAHYYLLKPSLVSIK